MTCTVCKKPFSPPTMTSRGGRPRTRCDECRSNQEKIAGAQWRKVRTEVLAGHPPCSFPGCVLPATEVDHIVPLARGGEPYARENLRPMCKPHNSSKGARLPGIAVRRRVLPAASAKPIRVVEDGNARTLYYADGSSWTETGLKW